MPYYARYDIIKPSNIDISINKTNNTIIEQSLPNYNLINNSFSSYNFNCSSSYATLL